MNKENILYAFIGGLAVAAVWAASVALTMQVLWVGLCGYAVIAALLMAFQDYDHVVKSLR